MLKTLGRLLYRSRLRASVLGMSTTTRGAPESALGPMLDHQGSLPRLPVPPLVESMSKYLQSLEPLLDENELQRSRKVVQDFLQGEGPRLHSLLQRRASELENWLSDWWLHHAYLQYRAPLIIHSSPGLVFPHQEFLTTDDQLRYATRLILAAVDFKSKIDRRELKPEKLGADFLDMLQYNNIFGTCRIPGEKCDAMEYHRQPGHHIVVARNNRYFRVEVAHRDGRFATPGEILAQLNWVVQNSDKSGPPIGVLTSQNRDAWYRSYRALTSNPGNADSAAQIQSSLFMVCLDQSDPLVVDRLTGSALQALHGNGINSANRWHDKTLQFLVAQDGMVGMTYEHSPAEGPPIATLMDHIYGFKQQIKMDPPPSPALTPVELRFEVSPETISNTELAFESLYAQMRNLDLRCFSFSEFGRESIKACKQSPDSFIQMAIQLAYYRLHGRSAPTYESASLRKFLHGRTETIRSASAQSRAFCQAMLDSSVPPSEKVLKLKEAVLAHKEWVNDAINGRGVDRLLLGMRKVEPGDSQIFKDKGYTESTHFRLSTSQVSAVSPGIMCFGAVVEDGYGCCYNPGPEVIRFGVSAFKSCPQTDAAQFEEALRLSLREMQHILIAQSSKL